VSIVALSLFLIPLQIQSEEFKFYGRGHVDPSHPIYGDEFLRTIIKGDKGAIIDVISHYGIVVIRMDLEQDKSCSTDNFIICFTGKVSKLKNVDHPEVGSEISIKLNLLEGTEEISINSGDMAGTHVPVFLENIGKGKYPEQGTHKISWKSCEVEFDENSNLPKLLKIIPQVMDETNQGIESTINSKFRFSYDLRTGDTSHVHLDYITIEDFVIEPQDSKPIVLNLTKAFLKIEGKTPVSIESRHYTLYPSNSEELASYNNDDEVVLEFEFVDGKWIPKMGLCKSLI